MMDILPIFYDHTSKKSLITPWIGDDVKPNGPPSAIKLAKDAGHKQIYLVSNNFYSFIEAWKNSQKAGIDLVFGLELLICRDSTEKSPDSSSDESKVIVWIKNGEGYKQAIKIYSDIYKNKENKYYHFRGSWKHLKQYWSENLMLSIPFFDSFLHKNILNHGSQIIPDFPCEPYFHLEQDSGVPYAFLIEDAIKKYGVKEEYIIKTKTIYYEKKKDFKAWQVLRAINNDSPNTNANFGNPELRGCVSDNFSWEDYLRLCK